MKGKQKNAMFHIKHVRCYCDYCFDQVTQNWLKANVNHNHLIKYHPTHDIRKHEKRQYDG